MKEGDSVFIETLGYQGIINCFDFYNVGDQGQVGVICQGAQYVFRDETLIEWINKYPQIKD